jgi:hypothetical protein
VRNHGHANTAIIGKKRKTKIFACRELPQIKRHRRRKLGAGIKGSLTHGKKTPENGCQ